MAELKHDKWVGTTYGGGRLHRWLTNTLKVLDVRLVYLFARIFVVPPTMIVNSSARKVMQRYFKKRYGYSACKALWLTYRNHCDFAEVVIDRFAMYAGKKFHIDSVGQELFDNLCEYPGGFIQLSSHIGNYELAGYSLVSKKKRFNALVFGGEKETVMANRARMFAGSNIRMIPVAPDMSHLFTVDSALSYGEILSMPADRVFGSQKVFELDFLGAKARFPQGPFTMAALRDVPMLYTSVMKTGTRNYEVIVKTVEAPEGLTGRAKAKALAEAYVRCLEDTVRRFPTQWYNYFDFWLD